jgi:hypothetical protein
MFGWGPKADDGDALARRATEIQTREDFAQFAERLSANYRKRRGEWQNDRLDRFLDAIAAFSNDYESFERNTASDAAANPWRLAATMLLAAKVYE